MKVAIGLAVGALVIGTIGAGVGVVGLASAGDANDKADAILQARDTARIIACESFNDQQLRSRAGDDRQTRTQFEALNNFAGADRTPEREAEVRVFLEQLYAEQAAASEKSYPLRDCSPEGVAAFYEGRT